MEKAGPDAKLIIERVVLGNKGLIEAKIEELKSGKYKRHLNESSGNPLFDYDFITDEDAPYEE
jgi:hypothetical protein